MQNVVKIGGKAIGDDQEVYVIAEVGINHNGNLNTAKELIRQAKWAGVSAVKLQTYITEKRVARNSPIYDILKQCELSYSEQNELFNCAHEQDIAIFSTPFDDESVDFLSSVGVPCYKIASFDIVNASLLKSVTAKRKPVIMSCGMANQLEIDKAVDIVRSAELDIILLHCISAYPVPSHNSLHLRTIHALSERYQCPVGFSDHTIGIEASKYAVAAGAAIIEKHFTLSCNSEGPDHAISTEPEEMKEMVSGIRYVREMMGEVIWSSVPAEKDIIPFRRFS